MTSEPVWRIQGQPNGKFCEGHTYNDNGWCISKSQLFILQMYTTFIFDKDESYCRSE